MIPHIYRYIYNIYIDIFPHCCALKKPEQVPFAGALKSSPGVVAAVLGAAAVLLWAAVTLPFVGTPLGTEVAACAFAVLFTGTGLAVANWGWAPSGCPGCSVFPGAGKSSATGLENVASTDDSGADVPVWIWKGRNCLSLTWTLNGSFKLPFSSSTIREVGKSLVCFSRSRNFYSFLFSFLKCFSMFILQSRQTISTPAEQQLTPDLATAFKYQGCWCGKYNRRSRFKTAVSGAKRTERWDKTAPEDRDHKLGFIHSGCDFLNPCSWPTWSRRIAVAFLCNNWIVTARGNLFWNHSSKQGELTHTATCMPAPGEAAGQGEELEGTKFAHIHTGWATWLKIIKWQEQFPFFHQKIPFT